MVAFTKKVTLGGGSFTKQLEEFAKIVDISLDLVIRKISLDLYAAILKLTRVDTGRLRGSWRLGLNRVDTSIEESDSAGRASGSSEGSPPTGGESAYHNQILSSVNFGDTIHFTNSLPYAEVWDDRDRIIDKALSELGLSLDGAVKEVRQSKKVE